MKRSLILQLILACAVCIVTNAARAQGTQTLMDSSTSIRSVWSFETATNSIKQNVGTAVGMYWGAVFNKTYLLGIGGDVNLSHTVTNYSYVHLLAQYMEQSDQLLHYGGELSLGFGSVKDYEHPKTSLFDNFFNTSGTIFYLAEPQVFGELNITPKSRLLVGLGYFFAFGLDAKNTNIAQSRITNQDLSGVTLTVSLKLGTY